MRWEQVGTASGMGGFGILAWATNPSTAMVAAGVAMLVLGLYVMAQFTEHRFVPARKQHRRHASVIFRRGVFLARRDREILLILAATFLVNGAAEAFERLYPARLVDLNFPTEPDPIVWFTALGVVSFAVGALVLWMVEARIDGAGIARRVYAAACPTGSMGLILLARWWLDHIPTSDENG